MGDSELLRALHDEYVWQVNAAVGEDRMELVWQLADEYLEQALRLMTAGEGVGCGRSDCAVCAGPPVPTRPPRHRLRWAGRRRGRA
jgi:hypothetical protein